MKSLYNHSKIKDIDSKAGEFSKDWRSLDLTSKNSNHKFEESDFLVDLRKKEKKFEELPDIPKKNKIFVGSLIKDEGRGKFQDWEKKDFEIKDLRSESKKEEKKERKEEKQIEETDENENALNNFGPKIFELVNKLIEEEKTHQTKEIEKKKDEAYKEGLKLGKEEGYKQAYEEGLQIGKEEGIKIGKESIKQEAYDEGFEEGKKEGFEKGKIDGFIEGEKDGLDKGEKAGYDTGFATGKTDGLEAGKQEIRDNIANLETIIKNLNTLSADLINKNEDEILNLIFLIVEKIIYLKLDEEKNIAKDTILEAFKLLPDTRSLKIFVSPEDYDYIKSIESSFFEHVTDLKHLEIKTLPTVKKGACKIESKAGEINADIDSKLNEVKRIIKESKDKKYLNKLEI